MPHLYDFEDDRIKATVTMWVLATVGSAFVGGLATHIVLRLLGDKGSQ